MIIFRVDGDAEIGLGHIYRCLSMAAPLKQCDDICFAMLQTSDRAFEIIEGEGFEVKVFGSDEAFVENLKGQDVVVLDGYRFSNEMLHNVLGRTNMAMVIDDFQLAIPKGFLILNQAPSAQSSMYEGHEPSKLFLGLDYLLLRSPFYTTPILSHGDSGKELLICFGGADPSNHTQRVVESLKSEFEDWVLNVIVGVGYEFEASLRHALGNSGRKFQIHRNLNARDMVEQIDRASMAVVSASGIMLEVISRRRPIIAVRTADNQRAFLKGAMEKGLVLGLDKFSEELFLRELNRLGAQDVQEHQLKAQARAVDGKAADRLRKILCDGV